MSKKLYKIPLFRKSTVIGENRPGKKIKVMEVDGYGLYVYYTHESDLTPEKIRSHLIGRDESRVYIPAESPEEAKMFFLEHYEGARIGTKAKALEINPLKPIKEYPMCKSLRVNQRDGGFVCGASMGQDSPCVLEGYDPPVSDCPIAWMQ